METVGTEDDIGGAQSFPYLRISFACAAAKGAGLTQFPPFPPDSHISLQRFLDVTDGLVRAQTGGRRPNTTADVGGRGDGKEKNGGGIRTRTGNTRLCKPLPYQFGYAALGNIECYRMEPGEVNTRRLGRDCGAGILACWAGCARGSAGWKPAPQGGGDAGRVCSGAHRSRLHLLAFGWGRA